MKKFQFCMAVLIAVFGLLTVFHGKPLTGMLFIMASFAYENFVLWFIEEEDFS